ATMQDAGLPVAEGRGVLTGLGAASARLDADQFDLRIADEWMEHAGRVAAAADAGDHHIRQPAKLFETLLLRLPADHRLKIADHQRKRVRADDAADDVVRIGHARHPVAQRLVDRIAERSAAAPDRHHLRAERLHLEDVEPLPAHVLFAHVYGA